MHEYRWIDSLSIRDCDMRIKIVNIGEAILQALSDSLRSNTLSSINPESEFKGYERMNVAEMASSCSWLEFRADLSSPIGVEWDDW